jgi:hypothetical protein
MTELIPPQEEPLRVRFGSGYVSEQTINRYRQYIARAINRKIDAHREAVEDGEAAPRAVWALVKDLFCYGSTESAAIAREFGHNPDFEIGDPELTSILSNEPRPCPFCGGTDIHFFPPTLTLEQRKTDSSEVPGTFYSVARCFDCYCELSGPNFDYDCSKVRELWNTRAKPT